MVHFNFKQGLFQAKGEILQYIGEDGKEYVPYDYNFEEDIGAGHQQPDSRQ